MQSRIVSLAVFFIVSLAVSASGSINSAREKEIKGKLANVQVPFIANYGQVDEDVKFYANTFGGTVFVTKEGEIVYNLPKLDEGGNSQKAGNKMQEAREGIALKEFLVGAKKDAIKGEERAETKVNYFIGNDSEKWKSNIPTYNTISLGEIYKGIELKLKAHGNNVEKIFCIHPDAEPEDIKVGVDGAKGIRVNEDGELEVSTELGVVKFTKPIAYQEIDGTKEFVKVDYTSTSTSTYAFNVGDYNKDYPLIIDPLLSSTFIGGSSDDYANTIAIDSSGNIFVAGITGSNDYPTTTGAYDTSQNGGLDVFISKLDNNLSTLSASTFIGGSSYEYAYALAIDSSGNIFVAGHTYSTDYPTITGAYDTIQNGGYDVFISRLDNNLSTLSASTFIGGSYDDYAQAIALDPSGNIFVTGKTWSTNYPTTAGAYDTIYNGGAYDVFISRLDNALSTLSASTFIGGSGSDYANALAIDSSGNIFVAGGTSSFNYPTTTGAYDTSQNGGLDVFISRLDNALSTLSASTFIGGSEFEYTAALTIDSSENIFVAGSTGSTDYPTTIGAYDTTNNGGGDVFISRLDNALSTLSASTFIGGSDYDDARALGIDPSGNIFVAGNTFSYNYPTTIGAYDTIFDGYADGFVSRLDNNLSALSASTFIGGSSYDYVYAIAIDVSGNIFVAGITGSNDYPTTTGAYDTTHNGNWDVFVSKLDSSLSSPQYTLTLTKSGTGSGTVTSSPAGIDCGSDCTENYNSGTVVNLTSTPDTGSFFTGWSGDADCSDGQVTMDADKNCTAMFDLNAYNLNITINPTNGGIVTGIGINCPGDCTESYNYNTSVTITAAANTGYTFTDWTGCDSPSGNQCTMTMNTDKTVTANFTPSQTYTLAVGKSGEGSVTVVSSPGGINCGADCQEAYGLNTIVTLTVTPENGTIFTGWAGNEDCSDGVVTVDAAKTCWATFTKPRLAINKSGEGSVAVTSSPAGINCGTNCISVFDANTTVTLTVTPENGTIFTGWAGDADCSDGVVTMDSPNMKTCWATFTKPTLSIAKGGGGTGTVTSSPAGIDCGSDCIEIYNANTVITLTPTPDSNSTFSYWAGNEDCSDGVVTMDSPNMKTCWAVFEVIP